MKITGLFPRIKTLKSTGLKTNMKVVQTIVLTSEVDELKRLTGEKSAKDAVRRAIEYYNEVHGGNNEHI